MANFLYRLSEYRESCIVGAHRSLTGLLCLAQTTFYCYGGHGVCRHLPLTFYLMNSPNMSQKSPRDIVSSSVNLSVVILVLALQMCIELARLVSYKREQQSLQTAINAERNLTFARLILKQTSFQADPQVEFLGEFSKIIFILCFKGSFRRRRFIFR